MIPTPTSLYRQKTEWGFVAPLGSDAGLIADIIRPRKQGRAIPPRSRKGAAVVALGITVAIMFCTFVPRGQGVKDESNSSAVAPAPIAQQFRVHSLNTSAMASVGGATAIVFRVSDLPFDFRLMRFGDFRTDANRSHIYYAGSGILVNATGSNATITLRESSGKVVSVIEYHGQNQIVFNGEIKSVSSPRLTTTYNGTDLMIQDWRNGLWSPSEGILVEHPDNVTVLSASFYIMAIEPQGAYDIPEFPIALMAAATAMVFVLMAVFKRPRRATSDHVVEDVE